MSAGVYVHIPFCVKKCKYCDFNSTDKGDHLKSKYIKALAEEISAFEKDEEADTAFIGGGTPTSVDRESLLEVIGAVKEKFPYIEEFSVEVNPKTLDYSGFCALKDAGVNRISFGLQSVNNSELKTLGRIHTFEEFLKSYEDCRKAGFLNINIDLMFSLPDQTLESWKHTLKTVTALNPEHLSCYSLIIEEGTPFYDMELNLPDEETDRRMYEYTLNFLADCGYRQYEISNFARVNRECRHNIKYWKRETYYGFGAGACSLVDNTRYQNPYGIEDYIRGGEVSAEVLNASDIISEHIFLGLRMTQGIDLGEFERKFGFSFKEKYKDVIEKYQSQGLMEVDTHCRLTLKGISVSNIIMAEFV
jgi:oxygen-independent coproporphyrinogen-3 oxidase